MDAAAQLSAAPNVIDMSDVRFAWPGRNPFALQIAAFSLLARERILLTGPSGCGKSTFLSLLCGILKPVAGRIAIAGTDIVSLPAGARDGFCAEHFGINFQIFNLLPYGSIIDNVLLPLSFAPHRRKRAAAGGSPAAEAARLLERLGLKEELVHGTRVAELSVGQQQRVAAARADRRADADRRGRADVGAGRAKPGRVPRSVVRRTGVRRLELGHGQPRCQTCAALRSRAGPASDCPRAAEE